MTYIGSNDGVGFNALNCQRQVPGGGGSSISFGEDGRITIRGTKGDDNVRVSKDPMTGMYVVNVNGDKHYLTAQQLSKTELHLRKGNDNVLIDPSVDVGFKVFGGKGRDHIVNYAPNMEIDGGKGQDRIDNYGFAPRSLRGGKGDDEVNDYSKFLYGRLPVELAASEYMRGALAGQRDAWRLLNAQLGGAWGGSSPLDPRSWSLDLALMI